ncbi:hypothetical protein PGO_080540 [Plasmodium gonderi]|uniref:Uncharacterized protein n=1 Tax=Plasmodium gonderi TaxID=77519 RepID=A0A1Y1JE03_PLAGO|nr:hypothetical protein PGO_080540 [Plasmodium gonderi]GAW80490.1 hypothetical protein PGO_080540 [Plasmodium gonderi]
MKVESKNNDLSDPFAASQIIGDKLLQGWTLLNECCHLCMVTPLVKQKSKEERFCAKCNIYISFDKSNEKETKKICEKKNDQGHIKRELPHHQNNQDLHSQAANPNEFVDEEIDVAIYRNTHTESYVNNNARPCVNVRAHKNAYVEEQPCIEFIKEIKVQHDEFNEILNKNIISTDEIENLLEYKNYIKERCGYDVGEWLNSKKGYKQGIETSIEKVDPNDPNDLINRKMGTDLMQNKMVERNREQLKNVLNTNHHENEGDNSEKREYLHHIQHTKHDLKISEENYFSKNKIDSNKYTNYEMELFILNKTKDVLFKKLNKYIEQLNKSDIKSQEKEQIDQVITIVNILERVNALKRNIHPVS